MALDLEAGGPRLSPWLVELLEDLELEGLRQLSSRYAERTLQETSRNCVDDYNVP